MENTLKSAAKRTIEVSAAAALLTGGQDRPYALGLALALAAEGVALEVVGSDEVDSPEMHLTPGLKFLNLRGDQRRNAGLAEKVSRVLRYYARLMGFAARTRAKVIHILWNNKFEGFDRTALMLYYKFLGRKVALTAHNVNIGRRDENDSLFNRVTLKIQYRLADHIFVHTEKMKQELLDEFGVHESAVTVLVHPVNDAFPDSGLDSTGAKQRLGICNGEKTLLFFGRIGPYKGLEHLITAFQQVTAQGMDCRLVIAGEPKKGSEDYLEEIRTRISDDVAAGRIIQRIQFIPDEDVELYFKAADALVLPYLEIFQSGVLFLGLTFGLPVIATDVGSFKADISRAEAGLVCRPRDPQDLARAIQEYFESDLFRNLEQRRKVIRDYAHTHHSWGAVGKVTRDVYNELLIGSLT